MFIAPNEVVRQGYDVYTNRIGYDIKGCHEETNKAEYSHNEANRRDDRIRNFERPRHFRFFNAQDE